MTEPSDSLSLAEHGAAPARDLPPVDSPSADLPAPPPLSLGGSTALFLDFDGTLVEIADRPDAVDVAKALPALLAALSDRLGGRMALVSGRSLAALEGLLGPLPLAMAGSHGGEFRPAAGAQVFPLADPLPGAVVADLSRFARAHGGLLVEPKPFSVAVHYRSHPDVLERLLTRAEGIASQEGLGLKHGKQVIELVMPGSDKGSAVARYMELDLFAGTVPLFVGDDVTDEDAFHAVGGYGGQGVLVGAMRPTAARWRLAGVPAVHHWLTAALDTENGA